MRGLQVILDEQTETWGIKVTQVQVKQVDLPQEMQRAIAAQAEAERTRRAKIIAAQGEFQASEKLAEAAAVLNREPISVTLRYLQTLIEIGTRAEHDDRVPVAARPARRDSAQGPRRTYGAAGAPDARAREGLNVLPPRLAIRTFTPGRPAAELGAGTGR